MTIHQLYDESIKSLPAADRLQLATLILNQIPLRAVVDYREEWTEEDLQDAALHSLRSAAVSFGEDEDMDSA